jgi:hypothetical protein
VTRATLSACVIASDEEARLPACLASLGFCDEVVLVDGGSRDRTREIAAAAGARVVENPWPGFAAQRNLAIDRASGDWILEIDADERIDAELAASIGEFLAAPPPVRMAALPMRDTFLGKRLGPSSRYPRYRHRLFRRGAFRHDESRTVHEGLWPDGPVAPLEGEIEHLLATSWGEALRDTLAYARLESAQRSRPDAAEALTGILLRPSAKLFYRTLLYGAWADGGRGLAKVFLECGADSLATAFRLRSGSEGAPSGLGQEPPRLGPVRIVGVALGAAGAERIEPWLRAAAMSGADVALVGAATASAGIRQRPLEGPALGALVRALDAEDQLRPVDALLPAGARERAHLRLAPAALRGAVAPLRPETAPEQAVSALAARTREPGPT